MARLAPTKDTLRTLFARSGNQCAFPECSHPLIDEDDEFVAQICHISAASAGGQRYDSSMANEERRSPQNLILLCHRHHKKTDNVERFSIEALRAMKEVHETSFRKSFFVSAKVLEKIVVREYRLTRILESIHRFREDDQEIPVIGVNYSSDVFAHIERIEESVSFLNKLLNRIDKFLSEFPRLSNNSHELVKEHLREASGYVYRDYPLLKVLWEERTLGGGNSLLKIEADLMAIRLNFLYSRLHVDPESPELLAVLAKAEREIETMAREQTAYD